MMLPLSPQTRDFIEAHKTDRIETLALQLAKHKEIDATWVLRQIEGWQKLRHKVPTWGTTPELCYPVRLSLEQCSSEATACYKVKALTHYLAQVGVAPQQVAFADLTGGLGVDFSFLAPQFKEATYVEQNADLAALAAHNLPLLGLEHAKVVHSTAEEVLKNLDFIDVLMLDPARRDMQGRKTVALSDCTPDVLALQEELWTKCRFLLLKLSPMLDVHQSLQKLRHVAEVHFVASAQECKEVFLIADGQHKGAPLFCVGDFRFTLDEEQTAQPTYTTTPEGYLYEPHAAVMKSGGFKLFATRWGLYKLHAHSHLYTSPTRHDDLPARRFYIEQVLGLSKAEVKQLSALRQANLTVRNFPETVDVLRRRLKLREGGTNYLFATTLADERHVVLVCRKDN